MNKIIAFIIVFLACPLIAGIYGILHDQLTYTISPEYYTRFKFILFNTDPELPFRVQACVVGFGAAWWTGIPIGLILASVGLIHYDGKTMLKVSMQAVLLVMLVAIAAGIIGFVYGKIFLAHHPRDYFQSWFIPENVSDLPAYITTGSVHNFSYIGGAMGIFAGAAWQVYKKRKIKKQRERANS